MAHQPADPSARDSTSTISVWVTMSSSGPAPGGRHRQAEHPGLPQGRRRRRAQPAEPLVLGRLLPEPGPEGDGAGQDGRAVERRVRHTRAQVSATVRQALDPTGARSWIRGMPGTTARATSTRADRQGA